MGQINSEGISYLAASPDFYLNTIAVEAALKSAA